LKIWVLSTLLALAAFAQADYRFSDGGRPTQYQLSTTEIFSPHISTGEEAWGGGKVQSLQPGKSIRTLRSATSADRAGLAPVFYNSGELPPASILAAMSPSERQKRMSVARRIGTPKLLVKSGEARYAELAPTKPVGKQVSALRGWTIVNYADPFAALDAMDWMIAQGGWEFTPLFARELHVRQALKRQVNDPLFPSQWHLVPTAPRNLNMLDTWDSFTGKGINIAVVDDGLEVAHEDLSLSTYPISSGYNRNFKQDGAPDDPSPLVASDSHGTNCAGLIGATGFNGIGLTGVAPESMLMGLRLIGGATAEDAEAVALSWQPTGIVVHVSSNSWGAADDGKADGRDSALKKAAMETAVTQNRDGLGTVIVVSAGNGRDAGDDSSYDEFSSSPFAMAVGAVGSDGKQSSYSESGLNLAISAFGGEFQPPNVLWTTNNSGDEALQLKNTNFPSTQAPVNYTDAFNGTSSAAPQVSGTIALMLQANPKLGYRDVKEILLKTASREGLTPGNDADGFRPNAGGFTYSRAFGAGLVNVAAAVAAAVDWKNLGPLVTAEASADGAPISDDGKPATVDLDLSSAKLRVEHVQITVNVKHPRRGDLGFTIVSPSGTMTFANNRPPDDGADFTEYTFTSPHFWGEAAAGTWKVSAIDATANEITGTLVNVKIKLYGTAQ
jgi:kexin